MRIPISIGNKPLTEDFLHNERASATERPPVIIINTFTTKPGKIDEFIAIQDAGRRRFAGQIPGLRGSRMYRSLDGKTAVLITAFDRLEDQKSWVATETFAEHRKQLLPLIEQASPNTFEIVYEGGEI